MTPEYPIPIKHIERKYLRSHYIQTSPPIPIRVSSHVAITLPLRIVFLASGALEK